MEDGQRLDGWGIADQGPCGPGYSDGGVAVLLDGGDALVGASCAVPRAPVRAEAACHPLPAR